MNQSRTFFDTRSPSWRNSPRNIVSCLKSLNRFFFFKSPNSMNVKLFFFFLKQVWRFVSLRFVSRNSTRDLFRLGKHDCQKGRNRALSNHLPYKAILLLFIVKRYLLFRFPELRLTPCPQTMPVKGCDFGAQRGFPINGLLRKWILPLKTGTLAVQTFGFIPTNSPILKRKRGLKIKIITAQRIRSILNTQTYIS